MCKRHQPSKYKKEQLLDNQDYLCYWCHMPLDSVIEDNTGYRFRLKIQYDHYLPFAISQSCDDEEFVASCHLCNHIKGALTISEYFTESDLRRHILKRWDAKGYKEITVQL